MHAGCQLSRHLPEGLLLLSPLSPQGSLGVQSLPSFREAHPFLGALEGQRAPYLLVFLEVPREILTALLRDINGGRREGEIRKEKAWWSKAGVSGTEWELIEIPRLALPGTAGTPLPDPPNFPWLGLLLRPPAHTPCVRTTCRILAVDSVVYLVPIMSRRAWQSNLPLQQGQQKRFRVETLMLTSLVPCPCPHSAWKAHL